MKSAHMQVTLILDPKATEQLEALRTQYYPRHLNKRKAHITLFYKLYLKHSGPLQHALTHLEIKPFEITIDQVNVMEDGMQLLISEKSTLVQLKRKLITRLDKWIFRNDRNKYFPHATIQHGVTAFKAQQSSEILLTNFVPIKATVIGLKCQSITNNKVTATETIML